MIETIYTPNAPTSNNPISQAVKVGNLYFLSGQTPRDLAGNLVGDTIETQSEQIMKNIEAILESQGLNFSDTARVTTYLVDMKDIAGFTKVFAEYFSHKPARTCVQVAALGKGVLVEVDVIAAEK